MNKLSNRLRAFIAIAIMLSVALPTLAHDFEVDGIYYKHLDNSAKTVAVTYKGNSYSEYSNEYTGNATIPSSITYNGITYSVTSIDYGAFSNCTSLTEITIPNSITSIGSRAFRSCTGLTSVTIPSSVTSIGDYAFINCIGLTSVTIPDFVIEISTGTFSGCIGLTTVTISNSVTTIESSAFSGCSGLTSITIPNSVTTIESSAFSGCSGLTSITIPNSVTTIGDEAFNECSELTEVNISDLSAWCKIDFSNTVANPLYYAKKLKLNDSEITDLVIPNNITKIKNYAFYHCKGLTSVTIPNSVTLIESFAFTGCTGLTAITIPNSVIQIGNNAFSACNGLTNLSIGNSVSSIGNYAFMNCLALNSINIPNSVISIGSYAFYGCNSLTEVTMGNSITEIGPYAFYYCTSLNKITLSETLTEISEGLFNQCTNLRSITIPASINTINNRAFSGCNGLIDLTIEDGTETLSMGYNSYSNTSGEGLFFDCPLEKLYLGRNLSYNTTREYGYSPFYNKKTLQKVTIDNHVTEISANAFWDCTGITSVKSLNITPPTCDNYAFFGCYNALLEVPADTKGAYSTATEWCNFTNIIEIATVEVSTQDNNATFEIPTTDGAVSYTVNVYRDEAMTQLVATTNYDSTGKIIPMATSLELSIDGFEYGTYYYNVVAKSETGEDLSYYTGSFEIDVAGISQIKADSNATEIGRYDIHGRLLSEPTKGINIVKYSDGTTRKEILK